MAKSDRGSKNVSRDYQTALHNFWAGRPRTAIEHLSKLLADDPEREDQFCLYRLWVEILAELGESETLRSLNEHLFARSDAEPHNRETYMALRGLICFEMDQIDAAALYARAVQSNKNNVYCQELTYHLKQRVAKRPLKGAFLKNLKATNDYYHLQTQARAYITNGDEKKLKDVMSRVEKLFPQAPLVLNFTLHRNLDAGKFKDAIKSATQLMERYPTQTDYAIYGAFAAIKDSDNALATELLERAVALGAENDIDAAALLGSCYTDLYQSSQEDSFREKASIFLEKASTMLEDNGFSAVIPSYHNTILSDSSHTTVNDQGETMEAARLWLVKLSATEFHEIRTKSEHELNYLTRPIGGDAKPGDLVFLAGDDYRTQNSRKDKQWRIAAVFSVASEAKWHPFHGYESSLQLVSKPDVTIPVDVHFLDAAQSDVSQFEKDDPRRDGVFELDYQALEIITETIREHNAEEDSSGRILEEIERMRQTS